jgi:hypothetical protein
MHEISSLCTMLGDLKIVWNLELNFKFLKLFFNSASFEASLILFLHLFVNESLLKFLKVSWNKCFLAVQRLFFF